MAKSKTRKRPALDEISKRLRAVHGAPKRPPPKTAFELVVWESAAYLANDARRAEVFGALKRKVGLSPKKILAADAGALASILEPGGMHPDARAEKLHEAARLALEEHGGDLDSEVSQSTVAEAKRALRKYPGVGAPGADKILLLIGKAPSLALESNGLRVLVRLGFAAEDKSYDKTYRAVQDAAAPEVGDDFERLTALHLLLREHGQAICKRTDPRCTACPLAPECAYAQTRA